MNYAEIHVIRININEQIDQYLAQGFDHEEVCAIIEGGLSDQKSSIPLVLLWAKRYLASKDTA